MLSKVELAAVVVVLVAGSWLWIARDTAVEPPSANEASRLEASRQGDGREGSGSESSPGSASQNSAGANGGDDPRSSELRVPGSAGARSDSERGSDFDFDFDGDETSNGRRGTNDRDRKDSRDSEKKRDRDDDDRTDPLTGLPFGFLGDGGGAPPEEPGPTPEELEQHDLDLDEEVEGWELAKTEQLRKRAENHPVKNDLADGEYPIERENYDRPEIEFDTIDKNRDGLMDEDEYLAFLVDTERITISLDSNGDKKISLDESGLSAGDFDIIDRDDNGFLKAWEIRQAASEGRLTPP